MTRFEWDENKNRRNIEKHGIDFGIAVRIFEKPYLGFDSPQNNELRYAAVGIVDGKIIVVVYTVRHEKIRIISARHARKKEKNAYGKLYAKFSSPSH